MDPADYFQCCVLAQCCLIAYEVADKTVDLVTANLYEDGQITNDPQDSVQSALDVFFIIGLHITILRVILYLWRIHLYRAYDDSRDETHHACNLWMSLVKVWLEAFPQATIALFYFGECVPVHGNEVLVRFFDAFSIIAFLWFLWNFFYYYFWPERQENKRHCAVMILMVITSLLSMLGIIFAGKSFNEFTEGRKRCPSEK